MTSSKEQATMLALGDSYTIGEGVAPAERWPRQVVALLRAEGIDVADPVLLATTGWTSSELLEAIDDATLHPTFDVVSLLIGVNNQYRGEEASAYRDEFRALLDRARRLAGDDPARVVVISIPDWGRTPFAEQEGRDPEGVAGDIDIFNRVNREEAERCGARYVDVTAVSREHPHLLTSDGLHPSGAQYARWARQIAPVVQSVLAPERRFSSSRMR